MYIGLVSRLAGWMRVPGLAHSREGRRWPKPGSSEENRMPMQFYSFDETYVEKLRSKDSRTEEHFVSYFTELMRLKLSRRLYCRSEIDDICQETLARVWDALRTEDGIREPERLGAFVNSVCNNILQERYRWASKQVSPGGEAATNLTDPAPGAVDVISNEEMDEKVRRILDKLSPRDRLLLKQVFLEEHDRGRVCRDFGVSQQNLRVLLYRARKSFKAAFLKETYRITRGTSIRNDLTATDRSAGKWGQCTGLGERK
jgi:RNA polymerase sigma-70 factor, ECF subfamily